jgi:hypothetical protein
VGKDKITNGRAQAHSIQYMAWVPTRPNKSVSWHEQLHEPAASAHTKRASGPLDHAHTHIHIRTYTDRAHPVPSASRTSVRTNPNGPTDAAVVVVDVAHLDPLVISTSAPLCVSRSVPLLRLAAPRGEQHAVAATLSVSKPATCAVRGAARQREWWRVIGPQYARNTTDSMHARSASRVRALHM